MLVRWKHRQTDFGLKVTGSKTKALFISSDHVKEQIGYLQCVVGRSEFDQNLIQRTMCLN